MLLNFDTFNHFKVVKCLQMTKTKHLSKVKQSGKKVILCLLFVPVSKGLPLDKKRMLAHEITLNVQTQQSDEEHIYLAMV